jgi:hypothetical protein
MEIDEIKCHICNEQFNDSVKIPRLLISCGHSYCQECLKELFSKGENKSIICPEDKTSHSLFHIEDLPKNITLLKLVGRKKVVTFQPTSKTSSNL